MANIGQQSMQQKYLLTVNAAGWLRHSPHSLSIPLSCSFGTVQTSGHLHHGHHCKEGNIAQKISNLRSETKMLPTQRHPHALGHKLAKAMWATSIVKQVAC